MVGCMTRLAQSHDSGNQTIFLGMIVKVMISEQLILYTKELL